MKIRNGFVSNSSTSSFICEICGGVEAGIDLSLEEAEMHFCENGHHFHDTCIKKHDEKIDWAEVKRCEFEAKFCPICQLKILTDNDAAFYLKYVLNVKDQEVLDFIKETYGNYIKFRQYKFERIKDDTVTKAPTGSGF